MEVWCTHALLFHGTAERRNATEDATHRTHIAAKFVLVSHSGVAPWTLWANSQAQDRCETKKHMHSEGLHDGQWILGARQAPSLKAWKVDEDLIAELPMYRPGRAKLVRSLTVAPQGMENIGLLAGLSWVPPE